MVAGDLLHGAVHGGLDQARERFVGGGLAVRLLPGVGGELARGDQFLAQAAEVGGELAVAAVQFADGRLVPFGELRFGVALAPVGRFEFFERVRLAHPFAGEGVDFELEGADLRALDGIADLRVALPGERGGAGEENGEDDGEELHREPSRTTESETGRSTICGGFLACLTSIANRIASRSERSSSSFHS